ncbi:MAG: hypothetical protein L6R35_007534 [Caloplaca aegaea]|nr:MAG: hypothetical protein L6R35_007534 [Caloplaca aegaea]
MKTFIPLLLFLSTTASAWSIAFHDGKKCRGPNYVAHSGVGKSDCIEFGVAGPNNDCSVFDGAFGDKPAIRTECTNERKEPFKALTYSADKLSLCTVFYNKGTGLGGLRPGSACETSDRNDDTVTDKCTFSTIYARGDLLDHPEDYRWYFTCEDRILS